MSNSTHKPIHVALGGVAGAALEKIAAPVIVVDDNLLLGPSSVDSTRHRSLRAHYWGSAPSSALERRLARAPGAALCVYVPPTPLGLLSLCRICSVAMESDSSVSALDLRATEAQKFTQGIDPDRAAVLDDAANWGKGADALRWSNLQLALAATLWRLWCRRSPVAVSRFLASARALHPQLASLGLYHAGLFPRRVEGRLLVSRVDELVLGQLSHEWVTPAAIYVQSATAAPELAAWLSHIGDDYIAQRLQAWSRHAGGRLVEQKSAHTSMTGSAFRWHPGGDAILDSLPAPDAAPSVEIGGALAYDPHRFWVCRGDASVVPYVSQSRTRG